MTVMSRSLRLAALAATLLAPTTLAVAQTQVGRSDSIYTWRGALPAHAQLTIRNFNGPIDVRPASGNTAEFRGVKRTRGSGSIQDIGFAVENGSGGDVSICASLRQSNPCDRDGYRGDDDRGNWRNDLSVAMTVLLPRGAQLKVATGNGEVSIENVSGDVQASTGNGRVRVAGTEGTVRVSTGNGDVDVRGAKSSVRVSTGNGRVNVVTADGPVEVHTGNGDIDVAMSALKAKDDMTFSTGSGSVRVTLPSGYNGELDASTGNGELRSDFDLKIQGRVDPRHVRATIGEGGPRLKLSTGNGRLAILKG
ncbi:hypothetical protein BH09GEM1_BH09GEM1_35570 [soil metagenome]